MLLNKIRKAIKAFAYCKTIIKKQIIAIKNFTPTFKQLYTNVASQKVIQKSISGILLSTNTIFVSYNKANKIIIKFNDKNSIIALSTQSLENILQDINHYF